MSYIINNSRGQVVAVVADGTVNTTATDLALVGRALTDYGTFENENYVFLLENFANSTAPLQPVLGQLWYNSSTDVISAYGSGNAWIPLASQEYVQLQKVSPAFTGVPTAPTAAAGTATTQLATTAFVTNSPQFAGAPSAPTAVAGTASAQLATTAFVTSSPAFAGVPTAPTAAAGTSNAQLATTAFVSQSPQFAGVPSAPTAAAGTNTTQLATTAFVQLQKNSPELTGTPTAPTPPFRDFTTRIATTEFVQNERVSPALLGVPTAPTPVPGTANTQIATAQFVMAALDPTSGLLGDMSLQNANDVNILGGNITGINPLGVSFGGTGASTADLARTNLGLGNIATQNSNEITVTGGSINDVTFTGGNISGLNTPLAVISGGTGATSAATARTNLGLGDLAAQNSGNVSIVGGTISGLLSPLELSSGGTGADNATQARTNLGLGDLALQNDNLIAISGGTLVGITQLNAANVTITSGSITGITPLAVADGGTGATSAVTARTNLAAAGVAIQIIAGNGLTGGGDLSADITLSIANDGNGFGVRYVSTGSPEAGVGTNGDIWYQIES